MASNYSYLSNADPGYIDQVYQQYLSDPDSVEYGWRKFFEGFDFARMQFGDQGQASGDVKEIYVLNLINDYRSRGHLFTKSNPVRDRRKYLPTLALENFGLSDADLDTVFQAGVDVGLGPAKLRDIVAMLDTTYCHHIGAQYMFIREPEIQFWLRKKMEEPRNTPSFSLDQKKRILSKLNEAVVFEDFLAKKYVGEKRFSIEGAETVIPAMDEVIESGSELGVQEYVVGMAHRGRLNVLVNILRKPHSEIFTEFEGYYNEIEDFAGDVKYHHGYSCDVTSRTGAQVHLSLCANPSHLEAVGPVAQGKARAKLDQKYAGDRKKIVPILIHGDAAIAAQGVVYEQIQMSELEGYQAGGTIHLVINNQVGFTTNYHDARTSTYCTDVAKVTNSPVFHVNGDDVEAVVFACKLAMEFRQEFHRDVFIDLLCYRRHGHNEGDEPRFTQPTLYKAIEAHANPREIYYQHLLAQGAVEAGYDKQLDKAFRSSLQNQLNEVKQNGQAVKYSFGESVWKGIRREEAADWTKSPDTGFKMDLLRSLTEKMLELPKDKAFFDKVIKIFENRREQVKSDRLDWSMGELLAYATLMQEGFGVRMSGQDVERGTFAHRHAVLKIDQTEEEYTPLNNLGATKSMDIYNSLLSEYAVLGFEYGYSLSSPNTLTLWEAQFGDFGNGAQIMIDQFISCSEQKWMRLSGLTMLLPHGYEGQGPEHSSARMERYLEMCSSNNWQIVQPTTPAQIFHLLRRQLHRPFRVPLIVFTPKGLLRLPEATSTMAELAMGRFEELIDDQNVKAAGVERVLLVSGKLYYDLVKRQKEEGRTDIAVVRLEQIYPLPTQQLEALKAKYKNAKQWNWVQDEPENMGPWSFLLRKVRFLPLEVISRPESASPATGYKKVHLLEHKSIMERAFAPTSGPKGKEKAKKELSKA
ncbi:MAG: 2-oxoglutarate dehydrogenase E1 component [Bacteroidetes bacterium]|nr:2-oxoglutarate dehydrogenase E1 component [Bacteroidota bacterium]